MDSPFAEHGNIENSLRFFQGFNVPKDARILDIGTRYGTLLEQMRLAGWRNLMGLDTDEEALRQGRAVYRGLAARLHAYDGNILPLGDMTVDVVTMFDVLEHIPNVSVYLQEVRRVLRPGGLYLFQTPNRYVNIVWEILHQRSFTRWRSYHCSLQTLSSLHRLLSGSGFCEVRIVKYPIDTLYNRERIRAVIGPLGLYMLRLAASAPLWIYPNFYGSAKRST